MESGRIKKIKKSLERFAVWCCALAMAFTLLDYSFDVSKRLSNQHACRWDLVENPKNSPYVARYCQLTKDTVVLRLYDAKEENLLAERIYFEENVALVVWTPTELLYRNSTGDVILLPPTLIDRLRAKFP